MSARERVRVTVDGTPLLVPTCTTVAAAVSLRYALGGSRRSVRGELRAPLCGMGICQECRVTVDARQHVLGCQTVCVDGMAIGTEIRS